MHTPTQSRTPSRAWYLLLVLAMALSACASGDDAGTDADADADADSAATDGGDAAAEDAAPADGEAIQVGAVFDLSGPTSDVGVPYSEGMAAYVEWRNAEGGVEGRPLQLASQDYLYDVAVSEQLYSQFVADGAVVFQGWGTGDTEALRPRVNGDEVPFMSASLSEELTDPEETPYNFVPPLTYSDQLRVALRHIADTAGGPANVVVFYNDSPFGQSPLADGEAYVADNDLDIEMTTIAMPAGATDYTAELTRASDADFIVIQNVVTPAVQLFNDITTAGLDATVVCLNWCANELFVELAGEGSEGVLGVQPFSSPGGVEGDLGDIGAHLEASGMSVDDIDSAWVQGWYAMHSMASGLEFVLADGGELDGPTIRAALEEMDPISTPFSVDIDFSPESHKGMTSGTVSQVADGVWAPVSDVITP